MTPFRPPGRSAFAKRPTGILCSPGSPRDWVIAATYCKLIGRLCEGQLIASKRKAIPSNCKPSSMTAPGSFLHFSTFKCLQFNLMPLGGKELVYQIQHHHGRPSETTTTSGPESLVTRSPLSHGHPASKELLGHRSDLGMHNVTTALPCPDLFFGLFLWKENSSRCGTPRSICVLVSFYSNYKHNVIGNVSLTMPSPIFTGSMLH